MLGASTRSNQSKPKNPFVSTKQEIQIKPPVYNDDLSTLKSELLKEIGYVDSQLSKRATKIDEALGEILVCLQQKSLTVSVADTLDQIRKSLLTTHHDTLTSIVGQLKDLQLQIESLQKQINSSNPDII